VYHSAVNENERAKLRLAVNSTAHAANPERFAERAPDPSELPNAVRIIELTNPAMQHVTGACPALRANVAETAAT
jgi:hypothetical protein